MLQTNLLKQSLLCAKKNKKQKKPYTIIKGLTTGSTNHLLESNWSR